MASPETKRHMYTQTSKMQSFGSDPHIGPHGSPQLGILHNQRGSVGNVNHTHPHASATRSNDRSSSFGGHGTGESTTNPIDLCPKVLSNMLTKLYQTKPVQFCLLSENPLAEHPTKLQQVRWFFLCPPHSHFGWVLTRVLGLCIAWAALWGIVGKEEAFFGGNVFSIFLLYVLSRVSGFFVGLLGLPPLLGMLLAGIVLNNVQLTSKGHTIADDIQREWRVALRDFSFITILIRAGLSLNPKGLMLMKSVVIRLALCPGVLAEGPVIALLAYFVFDMPFNWAFMLGFILAAVSPAVVVPSLLKLQNKGYGVEQGKITNNQQTENAQSQRAPRSQMPVVETFFGMFVGFFFTKKDGRMYVENVKRIINCGIRSLTLWVHRNYRLVLRGNSVFQ